MTEENSTKPERSLSEELTVFFEKWPDGNEQFQDSIEIFIELAKGLETEVDQLRAKLIEAESWAHHPEPSTASASPKARPAKVSELLTWEQNR
jgi:hypothetical protein